MQTFQILPTAGSRLDSATDAVGPVATDYRNEGAKSVTLKLCCKREHIVYVNDQLRMPVNRALRHTVCDLLWRGERRIVVDLAAVSRIDAAGIGELIRAFNMTVAVNGAMRVVNATAWVREMLERAGLLELLGIESFATDAAQTASSC